MSTLTIGRYDDGSVKERYAGWIEDADKTWIIWLDADGKPSLYYPKREKSGAVIGEPIIL